MKKLLYIIPAMVLAACSTDFAGDEQGQTPSLGGQKTAVEAVTRALRRPASALSFGARVMLSV